MPLRLLPILLLLFASTALAQSTAPRPFFQLTTRLDHFRRAALEVAEPEQKQRVADVFTKAQNKLTALRRDLQGAVPNPELARKRTTEIFDTLRDDLNNIFTGTQLQQMNELAQKYAQNPPAQNAPPAVPGTPPRNAANDLPANRPDSPLAPRPSRTTNNNNADAEKATAAFETIPLRLKLNDPLPDLTLTALDGAPLRLSSFKGKTLVLTFASASHPDFARHAAALEEIRRKYPSKDVAFLLIYTREADPAVAAKLNTRRARLAAATEARDDLKLTLPIALDPDDAAVQSLGGFPHASLVVAPTGRVAATQKSTNPHLLDFWISDTLRRHTP